MGSRKQPGDEGYREEVPNPAVEANKKASEKKKRGSRKQPGDEGYRAEVPNPAVDANKKATEEANTPPVSSRVIYDDNNKIVKKITTTGDIVKIEDVEKNKTTYYQADRQIKNAGEVNIPDQGIKDYKTQKANNIKQKKVNYDSFWQYLQENPDTTASPQTLKRAGYEIFDITKDTGRNEALKALRGESLITKSKPVYSPKLGVGLDRKKEISTNKLDVKNYYDPKNKRQDTYTRETKPFVTDPLLNYDYTPDYKNPVTSSIPLTDKGIGRLTTDSENKLYKLMFPTVKRPDYDKDITKSKFKKALDKYTMEATRGDHGEGLSKYYGAKLSYSTPEGIIKTPKGEAMDLALILGANAVAGAGLAFAGLKIPAIAKGLNAIKYPLITAYAGAKTVSTVRNWGDPQKIAKDTLGDIAFFAGAGMISTIYGPVKISKPEKVKPKNRFIEELLNINRQMMKDKTASSPVLTGGGRFPSQRKGNTRQLLQTISPTEERVIEISMSDLAPQSSISKLAGQRFRIDKAKSIKAGRTKRASVIKSYSRVSTRPGRSRITGRKKIFRTVKRNKFIKGTNRNAQFQDEKLKRLVEEREAKFQKEKVIYQIEQAQQQAQQIKTETTSATDQIIKPEQTTKTDQNILTDQEIKVINVIKQDQDIKSNGKIKSEVNIKSDTKIKPDQKPDILQERATALKFKPISLIDQKPDLAQDNAIKVAPINILDVKTSPEIRITPKITPAQTQKPNLKIDPVIKQDPKIDQKIDPITEITPRIKIKRIITGGGGPPPPPFVPPPFRPVRAGLPFFGRASKQGFNVFTRKFGSKVKISSMPLSKMEAINFGAYKVGNSARASFWLEKTNTRARGSFKGKGVLSDFYRKGEKYIEKRERRIKSKGELKEITFKGLSTLKAKKLFRGLKI